MTTFAILFIYVIIDYVGQLKKFVDVPLSTVAVYYFAKIPYILNLMISIIYLITTMLTVGSFARTSEITAMRASGISLGAISFPIIFFAVVLLAANIILNQTVLPRANTERERLYKTLIRRQKVNGETIRGDFIYKGYNDVIFRFKGLYNSSSKRGESVDIEFYRDSKLYSKVECKLFEWINDGWVARDATVRHFAGDGVQTEKYSSYSDFPVQIKEKPDDILRPKKNSEEMGYMELNRYIDILRRAGESPYRIDKLLTDLYVKISLPFTILIVALFGTSLTVRTGKKGMARSFGIGLFIGFFYYFFVNLGIGMGQSGSINPLVGAWFGTIIFAPFALLYFMKVARYE